MAFDHLLKKYFRAFLLLAFALLAWLDARGIAQWLGAQLLPSVDALVLAPGNQKNKIFSRQRVSPPKEIDIVLARNPFDSVTGPLQRADSNPEDKQAFRLGDMNPLDAPPCDGLQVFALVAQEDPQSSFVALSVTHETKVMLLQKGGEIEGKSVFYIGSNRVWFVSHGMLCQVEMFPASETNLRSVNHSSKQQQGALSNHLTEGIPPDIARGISRLSATEFNIDRSVVDKVLENQAELMKQARLIPEQENGKTVGIRLFGIGPGTVLGAIGLENGDQLRKINGFEVANPEKALEAYARLRTADHLTLELNRQGRNLNLDYNIR